MGEVKVLIETVPTRRQTQSIKDESTRVSGESDQIFI